MTVRLTPECLELLREILFLTTHLGNICLKETIPDSQNAVHFCLARISVWPCLHWKRFDFSWPGMTRMGCHTALALSCYPDNSNHSEEPLCFGPAVPTGMRGDTGGNSPQPEQLSCCWSNWLLCKLVCSARREAGRRKISFLCITRSRFGGSGKTPSCSHITTLPACHLSKSNYLEMAGEEGEQGYSSAVTQSQPQSLICGTQQHTSLSSWHAGNSLCQFRRIITESDGVHCWRSRERLLQQSLP